MISAYGRAGGPRSQGGSEAEDRFTRPEKPEKQETPEHKRERELRELRYKERLAERLAVATKHDPAAVEARERIQRGLARREMLGLPLCLIGLGSGATLSILTIAIVTQTAIALMNWIKPWGPWLIGAAVMVGGVASAIHYRSIARRWWEHPGDRDRAGSRKLIPREARGENQFLVALFVFCGPIVILCFCLIRSIAIRLAA